MACSQSRAGITFNQRVFDKIIERQLQVIANLDYYLDSKNFSGIVVDDALRKILK